MNEDFVMCARAVDNANFLSEPGESLSLLGPQGQDPAPAQAVAESIWVKKLRKEAVWGRDSRTARTGAISSYSFTATTMRRAW